MGCRLVFMVPMNSHRGVLTNDQQQYLKSTYLALYPGLSENDVDVNATIRKYYNVSTPFRQYGAYTRANHRSSLIMANCANQGLIQPSYNPENMTPGQVQYYFFTFSGTQLGVLPTFICICTLV